jgi:hypothetical protein
VLGILELIVGTCELLDVTTVAVVGKLEGMHILVVVLLQNRQRMG